MRVATARWPSTDVLIDRLPVEAQLLLAAVREPEWRVDEVRRLASGPVDWVVVRALATQERLLTVVWPRLQEAGVTIPEEHARAFRLQASVTEFQLSFTESVLGEVAAVARELSIDLLLLKGAALALTVYGAFRDRPMGDIDVLARPHDATRLWNRLREDGWALEYAGGADFYRSHHHLPPLVRGGGVGVVLEIHRAILPPRGPFDTTGDLTWADLPVLAVDGSAVRVLSPEAQLLHLAIHFAWSHALGRGLARTVRDVSAVIARTPPDWTRLLERSRDSRSATSAYWTLRMAQRLGGAEVPSDVLDTLAPPRAKWMLDWLERSYVEIALFRSCPSQRLPRWLWTLGMDPRGSGHGDHRPWESDADFRYDVTGDDVETTPTGLADRIRRIPAGLGYLRRTVAGRLGGPHAEPE